MRRSQVVRVVAVVGALVLGAAAVVTAPADAQIPITSTSSTTSRPTRSSTTTSRPSSTSSTKAPAATSTTRRGTTSSTATTAPPRTTSTIATPAPAPTTTTLAVPVSSHNGSFSPVFTWLAALGFLSGFALLGLQWFLTRPGRRGWTL